MCHPLFQISFWFGRAQPDIEQLMLRLQTCMRWVGPRQIRHSTHRALSQQCPSAEGSAVICSCFQAMLQLEKEPIKSYWVQKRSKEQICILPVKRNTVIGLNRIYIHSKILQFSSCLQVVMGQKVEWANGSRIETSEHLLCRTTCLLGSRPCTCFGSMKRLNVKARKGRPLYQIIWLTHFLCQEVRDFSVILM